MLQTQFRLQTKPQFMLHIQLTLQIGLMHELMLQFMLRVTARAAKFVIFIDDPALFGWQNS